MYQRITMCHAGLATIAFTVVSTSLLAQPGGSRCSSNTSTEPITFPPGEAPPPLTIHTYSWPVPCNSEQ